MDEAVDRDWLPDREDGAEPARTSPDDSTDDASSGEGVPDAPERAADGGTTRDSESPADE